MNSFKHSITLKGIPKDIFDKKCPDSEISSWLFDNVGMVRLLPSDKAVWDSDLNYSDSGQDIILTYNFKHSRDATIFAMRWVH